MLSSIRSFLISGLLVVLVTCVPLQSALAQDDEPLFEALEDLFKNDFLEFGTLIQTGAVYEPGGMSGFMLGTARLKIEGALDGGWGYEVEADLASDLTLKDALISYRTEAGGFTIGRYKAPFSYEELVSSSDIHFVSRSRVVEALAPSREIGAGVTGVLGEIVHVRAGIYNGDDRNLGDNNNRFLYTARIEAVPTDLADLFVVGANVAYNDDPEDPGAMLIGADFRIMDGALLVGGEAIYGERQLPTGEINPYGHYLTVGYTLPTDDSFNQLLVRWDRFTPDIDLPASDHIIFGYNFAPTSVIKFQANYIVPAEDPAFENHRAVVQFQLAF